MERLRYTVRRFLPLLVVLVLILGGLWFARSNVWFGAPAGLQDNAALVGAPPAPPAAPAPLPADPADPREQMHAQRGPADGPAARDAGPGAQDRGPADGPGAQDRGPAASSWLGWLFSIPSRLFWWVIGTPTQWLGVALIAAAVLLINRRSTGVSTTTSSTDHTETTSL